MYKYEPFNTKTYQFYFYKTDRFLSHFNIFQNTYNEFDKLILHFPGLYILNWGKVNIIFTNNYGGNGMFEKLEKYIESTGHWNGIMLTIILTFSVIMLWLILYSLFKKDKKSRN